MRPKIEDVREDYEYLYVPVLEFRNSFIPDNLRVVLVTFWEGLDRDLYVGGFFILKEERELE